MRRHRRRSSVLSNSSALFGKLRGALAAALSSGSRRPRRHLPATLLAHPDECTCSETVFDPETEQFLLQVLPLPEERLYPKERGLLDLVEFPTIVWFETDYSIYTMRRRHGAVGGPDREG